MKEGDNVRIKSGKNDGKTGRITEVIPADEVMNMAPSEEMNMGGARTLCIIQLDQDNGQDLLVEEQCEIIED